jgi:hypothetical protein
MGEYKQECPGVTYYLVHPFEWNAGTNMVHHTVTAQLCGVNNTPPNSPGVDVAS